MHEGQPAIRDWTTLDYEHLPGFEDLYLEGSFVLAIVEADKTLTLALNAALRSTHPWYEARTMSAHCFLRLDLVFPDVRSAAWHGRRALKYKDAEGREDLGTIDVFVAEPDGTYVLEGPWGAVSIRSAAPIVQQAGPETDARATRRRRLEAWMAGREMPREP